MTVVLCTGVYLHTHKSGTNGTPLDARFTNWALEARKVGYDPVLFGYTDITLDPRTLKIDDPHLYTYQGVLPGLRPVMVRAYAATRNSVVALLCVCVSAHLGLLLLRLA